MQEIKFDKEAREKIKKGVDTVANAVKITMGPKGKVVVVDSNDPDFTLDGVTVAHSIKELSDPIENIGASLIKMVAKKTNDIVGDGTTTSTVLTQALFEEGLMGVENRLDPILIKRAYDVGSQVIINELKKVSLPIKNKKQMAEIATISSRDITIGNIIAEIYSKIGSDGLIDVSESNTVGTSYQIVQGTQIDSGWVSPYFITDPDRLEAIVEDPLILVTTKTIDDGQSLIPILEKVYNTDKKSLVIIADTIEGEALLTLIKNKVGGKLKIIGIKAPGFGDNKREFLEDIAVLTGTTVIHDGQGTQIEEMDIIDLGKCSRVVSGKTSTLFIGGSGSKKSVSNYIKSLKNKAQNIKSPEHKAILDKRYARLSGGVAIIHTGSVSESESKEKKYRIEDAVNSTKSAILEGIIVGGGIALFKASKVLDTLISSTHDISYRAGLIALQKACSQPAIQILKNAGYKPDVTLEFIQSGSREGFNSNTGEYCDMYKAGIIDPLKVARVALENAVSAVGLLLITGAVIYTQNEKK